MRKVNQFVTCSDLNVPADDASYSIGGDASVHCAVDILTVRGGRKRQEDECTVSQDATYSVDVTHGRAVHREPINRRWRTAWCWAVQPSPTGVWEFQLWRRLQEEAGTTEMWIKRSSTAYQPWNRQKYYILLNIMFHAPMGRFQLELVYCFTFIFHRRPI